MDDHVEANVLAVDGGFDGQQELQATGVGAPFALSAG
jgi:hypothetical protein